MIKGLKKKPKRKIFKLQGLLLFQRREDLEVFNLCTKDGDQMFSILTEGQTKRNHLNLQHEGIRQAMRKILHLQSQSKRLWNM